MIEFDRVSRSFGRKRAVDELSVRVARGELFALLGPNGAGKTTTIKMLVGLLRPDVGAIRVGGHDIVRQTQQAACMIGYVPEDSFLYEKLSGREFLQFAAGMRGMDRRMSDERIARENRRFELGDFIDDLIETYSHGMKQRLVFAASLLHDPPVLVIDEPMIGLDPRSARAVKDLLRDLTARQGTAVLMSTHTLAVAEEIAHRIGILSAGRLHFLGTVPQLQQELSSPHRSLESLFLELTEENAEP